MRLNISVNRTAEHDSFENPTPEEIVCLWESFRSNGLSGDEAWNAIVAGMALDMALASHARSARIEQ
jgi:hypothetical protein